MGLHLEKTTKKETFSVIIDFHYMTQYGALKAHILELQDTLLKTLFWSLRRQSSLTIN